MVNYADIKEVTVDDAKQQILTWLTELRLPVTSWHRFSLPMACVEIGARVWNKCSQIAAVLKTTLVGQDASGDALTVYSKAVYNHDRFPASSATHRVRLTCAAAAGPYTFDVGDAVVSDGQYTYRLVAGLSVVFPYQLLSGASADFAFDAQETGEAPGMVALGTINRMVTTYAGVSCSNVETSTGSGTSLISAGADEESDGELKERNATVWATRNPLALVQDAYVSYARAAAPNVRRVRVDASNPRGAGTVDLILAGTEGVVGPADVAAVLADIGPRLIESVRVGLSVYSATANSFTFAGNVHYYSDNSWTDVLAAIVEALQTAAATVQIGGDSYTGHGPRSVPRAIFEDALYDLEIGGQPVIKVLDLTSPAAWTTVAINDVVIAGVTSGLVPVAVAR